MSLSGAVRHCPADPEFADVDGKRGSTKGQGTEGITIQDPDGENRSKLCCRTAMRVDADNLPRWKKSKHEGPGSKRKYEGRRSKRNNR